VTCPVGTLKSVDQPQTSVESGAPPLDDTLRRVVLYFRVLAYLWMVLLVVVTLVTDDQADPAPIVVALVLASAWTLVTAWAVTRPAVLRSWAFVIADGVVALLVASASFAADSEHLFHGGYPMSWVVVAGYAKGMPGSIGSALVLMVHQITLRLVDGDAAAISVAGDVIFLAFALIIGWVFEALPRNDALRRKAEARYEQEHRERERYEQRADRKRKPAVTVHRAYSTSARSLKCIESRCLSGGAKSHLCWILAPYSEYCGENPPQWALRGAPKSSRALCATGS